MKDERTIKELEEEQEKYYENSLNDAEKDLARKEAEHIVNAERKGKKYGSLAWIGFDNLVKKIAVSPSVNKYWVSNFESEVVGRIKMLKDIKDNR